MGEDTKSQAMTAYIDGQPVDPPGELPEIEITPPPGITVEQMTQAVETLGSIWNGITVTINDAAEAIAKLWHGITDAVFYAAEFSTALKWAEIFNPRLVHFYRHTKKKRIRKKYAKRILAWYREEARNNVETESE